MIVVGNPAYYKLMKEVIAMKTHIHQDTPNSTAITKWAFYSGNEAGVGTLFVTFVGGAEYAYLDCPLNLVVPMLTQASIGRYFAHTVKPAFSADRVQRMNAVQHTY